MDSKIELLLVNSVSPRPRIASDTALENGLALIRTYLEKQQYRVEVVDEQRMENIEKGVPRWCIRTLRNLVTHQLGGFANKSTWRAAFLTLAGWPVHALAIYFKKRYLEELINAIVAKVKAEAIPVVGIKLWYGESFSWSCHLAERLRIECPETIVVVGGPHVKVYGENVFDETTFDLAIMGPGEQVLENLLRIRRQTQSKEDFLSAVTKEFGKGRLIKSGGYGDICSDPEPTYFTSPRYREEDLKGKILFHTLVDGRGCSWNQCNFCSHTLSHASYVSRPPQHIVDEMEEMAKLGIGFFRFASSETPIKHGKEIAQAIVDRGLSINYSMFVRAGKSNAETIESYQVMIESGLRAVFMGGETGHDKINHEVMNKGVTREDIVNTIACIREAATRAGKPCRIGLSLIYPCPVIDGVTLEDVFQADLSLIRATYPDTVIVNPPGPFPGTTWFDNSGSFGFDIDKRFIRNFMRYEYSIYKPADLWDKMGFSLQGKESLELLKETGRLRQAVARLGIPTDLSDEYLMMTEAIGYSSPLDLLNFKKQTLLDIITGSTEYTAEIIKKINLQSSTLANTLQPRTSNKSKEAS